ncbi:putative chitinase 2 [Halotydeus destructor]|nr:putative chitinase 2 [Halotydeus destructor]
MKPSTTEKPSTTKKPRTDMPRQPEVEREKDDEDKSVTDWGHDKKMVCYYGSWAVYRPEKGKYPVENIDPFLCTHIIYSFTGLGHDNRMRPLDPWNDLRDNYGKGAFERFTGLKRQNPKLKTLIAIGGWNEGSIKYSNMVQSESARSTFVESVVEFLDKYNFDGLDLDWEYPAARGGKPEDKRNFVFLLRELKTAFEPKNYLLTAAVSAGKWFVDPAYDVPEVARYLDLINVMAYDYHGGWEDKTGHNAPMFARPDEVGNDRISNVNFSMNHWIERGAPREKLMLGMGTYGRSFTLEKSSVNGYYAPAPQKGRAGPYTREAGSLGYNEICEMFAKEPWTVVRDPYHLAPYAYQDRQWVGYDDIESITVKTRYANALGLGGAMIWSLETDDFHGTCHGEKYPLTKTINRILAEKDSEMPKPKPDTEKGEDDEDSGEGSTDDGNNGDGSNGDGNNGDGNNGDGNNGDGNNGDGSNGDGSNGDGNNGEESGEGSEEEVENEGPEIESEATSQATSSSSTQSWVRASSTTSTTSSPSWSRVPSTRSTQSSSSSTTPVPSAPENGSRANQCQRSGMHRDPKDCKKFYHCVDDGIPNVFRIYNYECPNDTVFDKNTNLCLWPSSVPECANYYSSRDRPNEVYARAVAA